MTPTGWDAVLASALAGTARQPLADGHGRLPEGGPPGGPRAPGGLPAGRADARPGRAAGRLPQRDGRGHGQPERAAALVASGVRFVAILALSDQGRPGYDHDMAAALHELGVPAFACTPDLFPELMAAALGGRDLNRWAAARELV